MCDKKVIFILLKILNQIRQENEETMNGIERSITTICKEEGISSEQVFYFILFIHLFFLVVH